MPREYRQIGKAGQSIKENTRRVLAHIRANPGVSRKELARALPEIDIAAKLSALQEMDLVFGERIAGVKLLRFFARVQPQRVDEVKVRGPIDGPVGARRDIDIHAPWPEPYLSDVGVRRDGLQFRDCASRRGDQLVYCWRRQA